MQLLIAVEKRFAFVAYQPAQLAESRGDTPTIIFIDTESGQRRLRTLCAKHSSFVLFISVHAVLAYGGPDRVEELSEHAEVCVWNVDSPTITHHRLPFASQRIKTVQVARSLATFWRQYIGHGDDDAYTLGVGAHNVTEEVARGRIDAANKDYGLLVPINLRWCARTITDVFEEVDRLDSVERDHFDRVFETHRTTPAIDEVGVMVAQLHAAGIDQLDTIRRLARLISYATQIWRREWVVENLLELPVTIDSNEIPERLTRGRTIRAEILNDANPKATLERMRRARAVLSTSFATDLFHDRISNALLLGSLAFIERNQMYQDIFDDGFGAIYFDYNKASLHEAVARVLDDATLVDEMRAAGHSHIRKHPIDFRFDQLLPTHLAKQEHVGASA